jgi:hypothetical protein
VLGHGGGDPTGAEGSSLSSEGKLGMGLPGRKSPGGLVESIKGRWQPFGVISGVILVFLGILWGYRDVSPIWDTRWYWFLCILPSLELPFDIMAFNCSNHPNMAFFLPLGVLARLTSWDPLTLHQIVGVGFGIPAVVLYYLVLIKLKGRGRGTLYDYLNVLAFAMAPVFLANIVNLSPEVGSMTYMLGFLLGLLGEQLWVMAFFGTCLVFTKEPWIIVYGLVGIYFFAYRWHQVGWRWQKLLWVIREIFPLGIPGFLLVYYAVIRIYGYKLPLFHGAGTGDARVMGGIESLYTLALHPTYLLTLLTQIYVASFMWIPVGLILYGETRHFLVKIALPSPKEETSSPEGKRSAISFRMVHFLVFYGICFYALTRVVPVVNPRYLMPMIPLTLLWMGVVGDDLFQSGLIRGMVLAGFCALTIVSQTRTFDPISRGLLGTFSFGRHELLHMTQWSQSCCGRGMDSLVYNFEFTNLIRLFDKALAQIKADSSTVVVLHRDAYYFNAGDITPETYRSVLNSTGFHPNYQTHDTILEAQKKYREFYFIDLPSADSTAALEEFKEKYELKETGSAEDQGYAIYYYKFARPTKKINRRFFPSLFDDFTGNQIRRSQSPGPE